MNVLKGEKQSQRLMTAYLFPVIHIMFVASKDSCIKQHVKYRVLTVHYRDWIWL